MKYAVFLGEKPSDYGTHRWYRVSPPVVYRDGVTDFIVTSASYIDDDYLSVNETYVFPADDTGEVIDWGEIEGSFRGDTDHGEALRRAGYTLLVLDGPVAPEVAKVLLQEES